MIESLRLMRLCLCCALLASCGDSPRPIALRVTRAELVSPGVYRVTSPEGVYYVHDEGKP